MNARLKLLQAKLLPLKIQKHLEPSQSLVRACHSGGSFLRGLFRSGAVVMVYDSRKGVSILQHETCSILSRQLFDDGVRRTSRSLTQQ